MTYYESAEGIEIDWSRAMGTLVGHGYPRAWLDIDQEDCVSWHIVHNDPEHRGDEFVSECWAVHAVDGHIDAQHVLGWLGY